ncbi:hypothetical protein ACFRQM_50420 [Streptomyces sp. NPDC056831]|uniref:hypothetical protein n=1 Tax=Streptomyces sp. NPDC056831 TaxID=3345954 RepID=UPI0036A70812
MGGDQRGAVRLLLRRRLQSTVEVAGVADGVVVGLGLLQLLAAVRVRVRHDLGGVVRRGLADGHRLDLFPQVVGVLGELAGAVALQEHAHDLLARPDHRVFDFIDRARLQRVADHDAPRITSASRRGLERTLDLAMWLDMYEPEVDLS